MRLSRLPAGDSQSIHKGQLPRRSSNDIAVRVCGRRSLIRCDQSGQLAAARSIRSERASPELLLVPQSSEAANTVVGTTTAQVAEQGPDHMFQRQRMPSGAGRGGDQQACRPGHRARAHRRTS